MKIAILTLTLDYNYGGILQAYALQYVLRNAGHQVEHLQTRVETGPFHPKWLMPIVWCKRIIRKFCLGEKKLPIFRNPHKWIRENTAEFIKNNISVRFISHTEWMNVNSCDYDYIIVGSDQVWRPKYAYPIERYFLDFLDGSIIKVAYAASFGTECNEFSQEAQIRCAELISQFRAVSVREKSGIELCRKLFNVEAVNVLDPTLLLDQKVYMGLLSKTSTHPICGELMCYFLDPDVNSDILISKVSSILNFRPFNANSKIELPDADIVEKYHPKVEQWIRGFYEANFIITDSFHACVFSIIFKKNFIVYANNSRGITRLESLLHTLNMTQRIVSSMDDFENRKDALLLPINYNEIEPLIERERAKSYSFLEKCGLC